MPQRKHDGADGHRGHGDEADEPAKASDRAWSRRRARRKDRRCPRPTAPGRCACRWRDEPSARRPLACGEEREPEDSAEAQRGRSRSKDRSRSCIGRGRSRRERARCRRSKPASAPRTGVRRSTTVRADFGRGLSSGIGDPRLVVDGEDFIGRRGRERRSEPATSERGRLRRGSARGRQTLGSGAGPAPQGHARRHFRCGDGWFRGDLRRRRGGRRGRRSATAGRALQYAQAPAPAGQSKRAEAVYRGPVPDGQPDGNQAQEIEHVPYPPHLHVGRIIRYNYTLFN